MAKHVISADLQVDGDLLNVKIEARTEDPTPLKEGMLWINSATKKFHYTILDSEGTAVKKTFTSLEELLASVDDLKAFFSALDGATKVGYAGKAGANAKLVITANTVAGGLDELVTKLDAFMLAQEQAGNKLEQDLASTTAGSDGSRLVGFEGYTGAESIIDINAGNMNETMKALTDQLEAKLKAMVEDAVSQTKTTDQALAGKLTLQDVVILGDLTQKGATTILEGDTAKFGDNIVTLNGNIAADVAFEGQAGWEVNRGTKGTTQVAIWDETSKTFMGAKVTVDGEGNETVELQRVLLGKEFDDYKAIVNQKLQELEDKVGNNIGDLATLTTDVKDNLVNAINEVDKNYNDLVQDLAENSVAEKGAKLVGAQAITSTDGTINLTASDVQTMLVAIVNLSEANAKSVTALDDALAGTGEGEGAQKIGYAGKGADTDLFYLPAGTSDSSIDAIVEAVASDRQDLADNKNAVDNLVANINKRVYTVTSPLAESHTITHNLGTSKILYNIMIKDGSSMFNYLAPVEFVDENSFVVTTNGAYEIEVVVMSTEDVSTTAS